MRIAVCIGAFEYGGQGEVVEREIAYLAARHEVVLLTTRLDRPTPAGASDVVIEPPFGRRRPVNASLAERLDEFDVVHCHDSLGFMLAAKASSTPWVVTSHGIAPFYLRPTARGALEALGTVAAYPLLYRAATQLVAISEYVGRTISRTAGRSAMVVRNGCDPVRVTPEPMDSNRSALLYVGEISRRKGLTDLFAGLASCEDDIQLDVVGRGDEAWAIAEAARARVAERVRFQGLLPDADVDALRDAALATYTASRWEGFCLPIAEGYSRGLPSISRRQGGMAELTRLSGAGYCFKEPREVGALVDAVRGDWAAMRKRAVEFASSAPWTDAWQRYEAVFEQVAEAA